MKTVLSVVADEFEPKHFVRLRVEVRDRDRGKKYTHTSLIIDTRSHPHEAAHRIAAFAREILRAEF